MLKGKFTTVSMDHMYSSPRRIIDWLSQSWSELGDNNTRPVNRRKRPALLISPDDADDEETPRRRNTAPLDAQSSSNASLQTSDSFDSAATPSKRRRKSRGIAMASAGAPDVVFLDGTEPGALRSLVRHFALVRREKHFVWPELLEQVRSHPLRETTFNDLTS